MNHRRVLPCLIALTLALGLPTGCGRGRGREPGPPAPLTVTATLTPAELRVGDPAQLLLTIEHPEGAALTLPELAREDRSVVLRDMRSERTALGDGRVRATHRFDLTSFRPGIHLLSTNPVEAITREGEPLSEPFPELTLNVRSLIAEEAAPAFRPPKPLAHWPRSPWVWIAVGTAALALLGALLYVLFRRRPTLLRAPAAAPPRPDEVALRRLKELVAKQHIAHDRHEPFFVELSDITRHYLEDRFGLEAPEQTTEEFLREAARSRLLSDAHQQLTREFLEQCDLVKFARWTPERSVMEMGLEAARRLILETSPEPAQEAA